MAPARLTLLPLLISVFMAGTTHAQPRPSVHTGVARGQNVVPSYEGWIREADGSISMIFGYFNRNFEEVVDIPVGPDNFFELEPMDRGQPTHFLPRRHQFQFRVPVPVDWPKEKRLVWTLTSKGKVEKAHGWLQPEWEIDEAVFTMNLPRTFVRGGGRGQKNSAPQMAGVAQYRATVSVMLKVAVMATDDGLPAPAPPRRVAEKAEAAAIPSTPQRQPGLIVDWVQWRGPGKVTFSPARNTGDFGKPLEGATSVRFSAPGEYVLRATAHDGALFSVYHVTVTVTR